MRNRLQFTVPGLFLTVLVSSCAQDAPNERAAPESAFRMFRGALAAHRTEAVWSFLGPNTRASLEAQAQAFEAAGLEAPDPGAILVAARVPGETDIDTVERVSTSDESVTLRLTTYLGETADVEMLRAGEGWVVELALPAAPVDDGGTP